jgi:hypothetical protein
MTDHGTRTGLLVPSKGDPPVPADGSCATCGKPRRVTKKQRKYCGDAHPSRQLLFHEVLPQVVGLRAHRHPELRRGRRVTWLKIDDGFVENEKVDGVNDRSFRLHVAALCYCARNLTDGYLSAKGVKVVCAVVAGSKRHVLALVAAGLWVPLEELGTYEIKNFLDYNPTADEVKEERRKARERMKALRTRRSEERAGERASERSPERSGTPSRPVPLTKPSAVSEGANGAGEAAEQHGFVKAEIKSSLEAA